MYSGLIPFSFSYYSHSLFFTSLQHPIIFTLRYSLTDGVISNQNKLETRVEGVNVGDLWEMEVDLRSEEKQKRTLHFFVRGKQQKRFFNGVPDRVEFGVCYDIFFYFLLS